MNEMVDKKRMKFIFASDSFKGSLTSKRIGELLQETACWYFPHCETEQVEVADGGEGTAAAVIKAAGGELQKITVTGPLSDRVEAAYGIMPDGRAIVEMAAASGLPLIPQEKRDPFLATTYGTGELIRDALKRGCRDIVIALGGSATNDGGMGAMRALGVRFLDAEGRELSGGGKDLEKVKHIDVSGMLPEVCDAAFTLMSDVVNPLLGESGAVYTFAKQKFANPEHVSESQLICLENGMENYAGVLEEACGIPVRDLPGAGAAGGMGAACMAFLQAHPRSGIETLLDLVNFSDLIKGADLIITGEGRADGQSASGKVLYGIGQYGKEKGIPVVAIVGSIGEGADLLYDCGITSIFPTVNGIMSLKEAMDRAEELYCDTADRLFRLIYTLQAEQQSARISAQEA